MIARFDEVKRGERPPWIVPDELWRRIEPLLPVKPRRYRSPGRSRLPDRQVLCGILFVLHTGIQREFLPQELGFGSGMTCWRRLEEWNAGPGCGGSCTSCCWPSCTPPAADWSRAVIDSSHVRAPRRGPQADRARSTAPGRAPNIIC
jgi:transposase